MFFAPVRAEVRVWFWPLNRAKGRPGLSYLSYPGTLCSSLPCSFPSSRTDTGAHKTDDLFFAGDLGQRIFQAPFSWKSLGVDIRGRSHILRTNYRTSHQIREQADKLLDPEIADVDGNTESRKGTVSVFNGPEPIVEIAKSIVEESDIVTKWTMERAKKGVKPGEIGIFVRSDTELVRARKAIEKTGIKSVEINGASELSPEAICLCTMHLAKGLEFKAVVVAACDDEIIPLQSRIESVTEESDLEEVYNTERHLLYVACTRARENLLITGVDPVSEFLDDLRSK